MVAIRRTNARTAHGSEMTVRQVAAPIHVLSLLTVPSERILFVSKAWADSSPNFRYTLCTTDFDFLDYYSESTPKIDAEFQELRNRLTRKDGFFRIDALKEFSPCNENIINHSAVTAYQPADEGSLADGVVLHRDKNFVRVGAWASKYLGQYGGSDSGARINFNCYIHQLLGYGFNPKIYPVSLEEQNWATATLERSLKAGEPKSIGDGMCVVKATGILNACEAVSASVFVRNLSDAKTRKNLIRQRGIPGGSTKRLDA